LLKQNGELLKQSEESQEQNGELLKQNGELLKQYQELLQNLTGLNRQLTVQSEYLQHIQSDRIYQLRRTTLVWERQVRTAIRGLLSGR
jgi:predicted nuclease with TOPRIM domain